MENKILNSSYNNVEYGIESTTQQQICVSPSTEDQYEDNLSDDMEDVYTRKRLHEDMVEIYEQSKYYEKYGQECRKIDRSDMFDIYYTFKEELLKKNDYNIVQIFCEIAEFFDFKYKTLYNDILTLEDKVGILEFLEETYGLEKQFSKSKKLF